MSWNKTSLGIRAHAARIRHPPDVDFSRWTIFHDGSTYRLYRLAP